MAAPNAVPEAAPKGFGGGALAGAPKGFADAALAGAPKGFAGGALAGAPPKGVAATGAPPPNDQRGAGTVALPKPKLIV